MMMTYEEKYFSSKEYILANSFIHVLYYTLKILCPFLPNQRPYKIYKLRFLLFPLSSFYYKHVLLLQKKFFTVPRINKASAHNKICNFAFFMTRKLVVVVSTRLQIYEENMNCKCVLVYAGLFSLMVFSLLCVYA